MVRTLGVTSSPRDAVAARGAAHEAAALVGQRDAEAVDLQLGDVGHRRVAKARAFAHALVEGAQLVLVVGVVETEHRADVLDGGETLGRRAGDALGRRVRGDEVGVLGLEPLELVQERSNASSEISGALWT